MEIGQRIADGFIYKLKLVTNDRNEYVNKKWLKPGTQLFGVGSSIGKYDEEAPIINVVDFAKQPGIDKKASENDLLKYIKSLVKEASMEKITQTLG